MLRTMVIMLALCTASWSQIPPTPQQAAQQMLEQVQGKDFSAAIALGSQAIQRWPRVAELHHLLGLAHFQSGALDPAVQELTQAAKLEPAKAELHYDLALSL